MSLPKISIITVTYNASRFLQSAIDSVKGQNYHNLEYIVIDGGSTDDTIDIIKENLDVIDQWKSERDQGIYDAMNKGVRLATGDLVGLLNADDYYAEGTLNDLAAEYIKCKDSFDVYHGDVGVVWPGKIKVIKPDADLLPNKMSLNHPTCFIRREVYSEKVFNVSFSIAGDYEFLLWCYLNNKKFYYIDKVLTYYRPVGKSSLPSFGNADAFHIWKKYFGWKRALWLFGKDSLYKLFSVPLKMLLYRLVGEASYLEILASKQ
jgi:glycosyltransferase involved in cell wall biosynthesis